MLALLIHITHRIIVYITLFGFILPKKYLKYHLFMWPIILLHWLTNNNRCILTELEEKITGKPWKESDFSIKISKSLGVYSEKQSKNDFNKGYIIFFSIGWFISLCRYMYT